MIRKFIFAVIFFSGPLLAKDFVTAHVMGQLGNQMFIIAATEALARENGAEAIFPDLLTETRWNVQENREKIFTRVNAHSLPHCVSHLYKEPHYHYKEISYKRNLKLHGYFQSEKYFYKYRDEIKALFAPSEKILKYLNQKYANVISHPKSVALHFRNYLKDDPEQKYHPNVTRRYLFNAINMFPKDSLFVVCSNDIPLCKRMLNGFEGNFVYIEGEHFHHDFYLMSLCKNNIISNSSYSWWAAYLNKNPDKVVVAPKRWFTKKYRSDTYDNTPPSWIKLGV